jgi:hypothetical protein
VTEPPLEDIIYEGPIEEISVQSIQGPETLLAPDGSKYAANEQQEWSPYIPVHIHRLDIAKKCLASREQTLSFDQESYRNGRIGPGSLSQYYNILSERSAVGAWSSYGAQGRLVGPHQYFGLPYFWQWQDWDKELEKNSDLQVRELVQLFKRFS